MGKAARWKRVPGRIWLAVAGLVGAGAVAYLTADDGKDPSKGGQPGAWSPAEREEAADLCRYLSGLYGEPQCRVDAFCKCAVVNYEGRAPFREFRDKLAADVAHYVRKGEDGYVCTHRASIACPEPAPGEGR